MTGGWAFAGKRCDYVDVETPSIEPDKLASDP
jgi:hypothetical protein